MQTYITRTNHLTVPEYQSLRNTTLWKSLPDHQVKKALDNDLYSVSVYKEDMIIGMGRVIGDGAIYFYIQDVIVRPKYKGKGIGRLIMQNIEQYLAELFEAYVFVGLMAAKDSQGFYQELGYHKRKDDSPGMYKILKE